METYKCDKCDKNFDKKMNYERHMKRKTPCAKNIVEKPKDVDNTSIEEKYKELVKENKYLNEEINDLNERIGSLKEEIYELYEKNDELEEKNEQFRDALEEALKNKSNSKKKSTNNNVTNNIEMHIYIDSKDLKEMNLDNNFTGVMYKVPNWIAWNSFFY